MMAPDRTRQAGFTMIELMIVMAMMAPLLLALGNTSSVVNKSVDQQLKNAEVSNTLSRTAIRISNFIRAGKLSSIKMSAIQADVVALRATTIGEWVPPTDLVWRPGITFTAADGLLSLSSALNTSSRRIVFVMDNAESDNDLDDDGDGLVDEGNIHLVQGTTIVATANDIEGCVFMLDGRLLTIQLSAAEVDDEGRVHRASLTKNIYMRNN